MADDLPAPAEALVAIHTTRPVPAPCASAATLGALVAELQGRPAPDVSPATVANLPLAPEPVRPEPEDMGFPTPLSPVLSAAPAVFSPADASATPPPAWLSSPADDGLPDAPLPVAEAPLAPLPSPRHPLATELDRLRADVYDLFEDAVGRDRAAEHEVHVLEAEDIPSPVPPHRTPDYLRALLAGEPPKRWHFFKRARTRVYPAVAGRLLAFHAANGHTADPASVDVIHEVTRLWTRLHR